MKTAFHGRLKATAALCAGVLAHGLCMAADDAPRGVAALGRLEPEGGIIHVAAPSTPLSLAGSVISELRVAEGDRVEREQVLAVTDAEPALSAAVEEARTELELAERAAESARSVADEACVTAEVAAKEAARRASLLERELAAREEVEASEGAARASAASCTAARSDARVAAAGIDVARARLVRRQAEHARSFVLAPFDGKVLRILAEPGEYVGADGVLELGRVDRMYAIAEVHETEVGQVSAGQRATVSSVALPGDLAGTVRFIRPKVQKQDETGTDPAARQDARIVEVGVLLDDAAAAARLTNLQVEVVIEVGEPNR